MGVSSQNEFLKDPDFENKYGAIKWIRWQEGEVPKQGRLYINGQVMNYRDKGRTAATYWQGPDLVTLRLNNVDYLMSVDRPPVTEFELGMYLDRLTRSMTMPEVIDQLKRSQPIWTQRKDKNVGYNSREGCFIVIENLVDSLARKGYDPKKYAEYFPDERLVCLDYAVNEKQIQELEAKGYIVCPRYFSAIGMPSASDLFPKAKIIEPDYEEPIDAKEVLKQFTENYGLEVGFEDFSKLENSKVFYQLIRSRLSNAVTSVSEINKEKGIMFIGLGKKINEDLLYHPLIKPKRGEEEQELLFLLRGFAFYGLRTGIFKNIFITQGKCAMSFGLNFDPQIKDYVLKSRILKRDDDGESFISIKGSTDELYLLREILLGNTLSTEDISQMKTDENKPETAGITSHLAGEPPIKIPAESGEKTANVAEISDEDAKIKAAFKLIPIVQPSMPEDINLPHRVVKKTIEDALQDVEPHVKKVVESIPEIEQALDILETATSSITTRPNQLDQEFRHYVAWRNSDNFYGKLGDNSGYLTGKHLVELFAENYKADIATVEIEKTGVKAGGVEVSARINKLNKRLKNVINSLMPEDEKVDEFSIVLEPSQKELAQLAILRGIQYLTTGVALPNDLFIFEGTGTRGLNLGRKAIGMHRALFETSFEEAFNTFSHEIVHNIHDKHDADFDKLHSILLLESRKRLKNVSIKYRDGVPLTESEVSLLDMEEQWERLRAA